MKHFGGNWCRTLIDGTKEDTQNADANCASFVRVMSHGFKYPSRETLKWRQDVVVC